jgi:cytochrome c oxidase subunit II
MTIQSPMGTWFGIALPPLCPAMGFAQSPAPLSPTNIFSPSSAPAHSIFALSLLVLAVCTVIFIIVFSLLVYSAIKFRRRANDDGRREPTQVYGSNQIELAWTVIPVLIVIVLFLASTRVIKGVQDAEAPPNAVEVTAIGHQFWWEFRYPKLGVVTANELHVPVSDPSAPRPTFIQLLSADTDHSFWVPRLNGKTDLIPNHPNRMWIAPDETGLYLGQCAQYCGTQHALMLLRVYVDSPEQFAKWVKQQAQPADPNPNAAEGRRIFETTACIDCHTVAGSGAIANGRYGPDLTHLMSRDTLAAGAAPNTHENLRQWIEKPDAIKPGSLMPAMGLTPNEIDAVVSYLETLH